LQTTAAATGCQLIDEITIGAEAATFGAENW
jgi:hypothetical protein